MVLYKISIKSSQSILYLLRQNHRLKILPISLRKHHDHYQDKPANKKNVIFDSMKSKYKHTSYSISFVFLSTKSPLSKNIIIIIMLKKNEFDVKNNYFFLSFSTYNLSPFMSAATNGALPGVMH